MDPFATPPPRRSSRPLSTQGLLHISKQRLMALFQSIHFDEIVIPRHCATEYPDDTISFLQAVGNAFVSTLIQHYPRHSSPKKLLEASVTQDPESPTPMHAAPPASESLFARQIHDDDRPPDASAARPKEDLKTTMRRMAVASIMARQSGMSHPHNLILTQDDHIAPMRPMTPPPINPDPRPYTFRSRPAVLESLRDEIHRLSESTEDPYTITSVGTALDNSNHQYVYVKADVTIIPDQTGRISTLFEKDTYRLERFAMFDTGADVCIICDDVLEVRLEKPLGVLFSFMYALPFM